MMSNLVDHILPDPDRINGWRTIIWSVVAMIVIATWQWNNTQRDILEIKTHDIADLNAKWDTRERESKERRGFYEAANAAQDARIEGLSGQIGSLRSATDKNSYQISAQGEAVNQIKASLSALEGAVNDISKQVAVQQKTSERIEVTLDRLLNVLEKDDAVSKGR